MESFWIAVICLCLVGTLSIYKKWLTLAGAIGMILIGTTIDFAFGLRGLFVIFSFFVSANLVSKLLAGGQKNNSHEQRTIKQVMANGGAAFFAAIMVILWGPSSFALGFFLASIAGAAADTFASEIGGLKGGVPYHIALHKRVPPGLSGAVTFWGSVAGLIGATLIGVISAVLFYPSTLWLFLVILLIGWIGQWVDTFLGAYFQARHQCPNCHLLTDQAIHCSHQTRLVNGFPWMTNNLVNGLTSLVTGLIGGGIFVFIAEVMGIG